MNSLLALVASILVPVVGVVTLFIERGTRRGLGMAGFLLTFGASSVAGFLATSVGPEGPPPVLGSRLSVAFGVLAYLPMVDFLGDLAVRAGAERPLGISRRTGAWIMRLLSLIVTSLLLWTNVVVAGTVYNQGWQVAWAPAWWILAGGGALFVVWGMSCWNAERRRRGRLETDLIVWLVALFFLIAAPVVLAALAPTPGWGWIGDWVPATTTLGAFATLVGLILSRDLELRRLRHAPAVGLVSATSAPSAASSTVRPSTSGPMVVACRTCSATFQSMPPSGTCPLDGGPVEGTRDPLVDSLVDGRYRILRFLGAGGMARVYAAEHSGLGTRFAIKVLRGDLLQEREMAGRFLREARAASSLVSRHIVRVHGVGEIRPGVPYMALELLEGPSLARFIRTNGALRPEGVALLGAQLAEGLAVAHAASIVHRDLKPDNVILVRTADRDVAKIVDFGLAKLVGATEGQANLTATGAVFGTPLYMAPEQVRGEAAGPAADLYALGLVLYEASTGAHPFSGETPMQVMFKHLHESPERVPIEGPLGDLIMALLEKDVAARAGVAQGLAASLAELARGVRRFGRGRSTPPRGPEGPIAETLVDARARPKEAPRPG